MTTSNHDENNYKIQRIKEARLARRVIIIVLTTLFIILVIGGFAAYNYIKHGLSPVDPDDQTIIDIEIPLGSSVDTIGKILEENEVINNGRIFKYYVKFKNESGFQAGQYKLSKSMTIDEIIESLKTGKILVDPLFTITFPEGSNIEEIANIIASNTSIERDEFIEKMLDVDYIKSLIAQYPMLLSEEILHEDVRYPLEGYLYAATYPFYDENPTIEDIVEVMLSQTDARIKPYLPDIEESNFTVHEMLTMASLIEKEAVTEEDRKMISGVFYNRMNLDQPMPLQTDPTVLYALGKHKESSIIKI